MKVFSTVVLAFNTLLFIAVSLYAAHQHAPADTLVIFIAFAMANAAAFIYSLKQD